MRRKSDVERRELKSYPIGTVFNPHTVGQGYIVHFEYEAGSYFECRLHEDGTLSVRVSGSHSDLLATHHHCGNGATMVARRWNSHVERHVELIKADARNTNSETKSKA